jgi:hypothetical protein
VRSALRRLSEWSAGTPLARTRCSRFAEFAYRYQGRRWQGGADRHRPGESIGVAVVEAKRTRALGPSAHGVGSPHGVRQPLLFLAVGIPNGGRPSGRPTPKPHEIDCRRATGGLCRPNSAFWRPLRDPPVDRTDCRRGSACREPASQPGPMSLWDLACPWRTR